ncbi:MAG: hypothetical protein LBG04_00070 [Holosporaceae bacterium]|nr:hypothetical protein [Holosporaceae bacterium]
MSGRNAEFFHGWFSKKTRVVCGDMRYLPLLGNLDGFDRCLGDGVLIWCIIPREENKDRHVNNLVVGIKYGNISFVFPGDANQNWFSENCEQLKALMEEFGGVDFLLIPHHGSMSDTGFFMKDAIEHFNIEHSRSGRLICVISSDPEKGRYYMPRQGVQYLFPCVYPHKVKPHSLSLAKVNSNKEFEGIVTIAGLISPVFSTADSVFGYKIVCNGFGFWMYNGLGIPRPGEGIDELKVFDYYGVARRR